MAARDDETWLFVVEWFDPMPRLKRMYLLKYFVQQRQVEMVDVKSKKMFLKKSACPSEITAEDFAVGKKLLLYSRELDIIDYGDLKTKQKLAHQHQQTVVLLGSDIYVQWGSILDRLNEHLSLVAVKTIYPTIDVAERICQVISYYPRPLQTTYLISITHYETPCHTIYCVYISCVHVRVNDRYP